MNPFPHITYALRNAEIKKYPFPHFFAQNVFPDSFYLDLLESLPTPEGYKGNENQYNGRKFADPTQNPILQFMQETPFLQQIGTIFQPYLKEKFQNQNLEVFSDLRLVRDGEGYSIGPHTDAAWKLVSLLFYLPPNDALKDLGTSIYTPKVSNFTCEGGPHYPFDRFNKIFTAPFLPNTCFGFWKTNHSFHGVEPITIPCTRNILLYNVYDKAQYDRHHQTKG